jgi:hypothetical protein
MPRRLKDPTPEECLRSALDRRRVTLTKHCVSCGLDFPVTFFRANHRDLPQDRGGTRRICLACEQTARDARKKTLEGRMAVKVRWAIWYKSRRLRLPVTYLASRYGWNRNRMWQDALAEYAGRCWGCEYPYKDMRNGLFALVLATVDASEPPYYGSNVRWTCNSCVNSFRVAKAWNGVDGR